MHLRSIFHIPLTLCLLASLAVGGCGDDGNDDGGNATEETGDGDGDPGDGDGAPGDGDGDPGDGDGDPGDGDGSPGDGDGSPGDGDGSPGDGDGSPGDGDGSPGDGDGAPDECAAFDAEGVGPCDAFFGYSWDGSACVGVSGCECVGTDCDMLYPSPDECEAAHAQCEPGAACEADQAEGVGPCDAFFGWAWDGIMCVGISGCECVGPACGSLPLDLAECEAAHADCQ